MMICVERYFTCWFSTKSGQYLLRNAPQMASIAFTRPAADFWVASSSASRILDSNISTLDVISFDLNIFVFVN